MTGLMMPVVVSVAALIASTVSGVAGFGGAAIMLPTLVWAFGIREAIPILTLSQLIGNLARVWFNRKETSLPVVKWFALGAMPSAIIGAAIFATTPSTTLVRILGAFLLFMVVYRHTSWGRGKVIPLRGFLPLGSVSGFISSLLGVVGPFMAPFFLSFGLLKGGYIGTEALATATMHFTKLSVYGGYSMLNSNTVLFGLGIGSVNFVGSYIAKRIMARLSEQVFLLIIEGILLVSGIFFIVTG